MLRRWCGARRKSPSAQFQAKLITAAVKELHLGSRDVSPQGSQPAKAKRSPRDSVAIQASSLKRGAWGLYVCPAARPANRIKMYGPPRLQAISRSGLAGLRRRIRSQDHRAWPRLRFARPGPHEFHGVKAPHLGPGFQDAGRRSGHLVFTTSKHCWLLRFANAPPIRVMQARECGSKAAPYRFLGANRFWLWCRRIMLLTFPKTRYR